MALIHVLTRRIRVAMKGAIGNSEVHLLDLDQCAAPECWVGVQGRHRHAQRRENRSSNVADHEL